MEKRVEFKPDKDFGSELNEEQKAIMKQHMMETSRKPESIPKFFYHASPLKNRASILENGLKTHPLYGEIYFCEKLTQALKFAVRPSVVFKVNTDDLDKDLIFLSNDHVKIARRNFEAFTYYKNIEPKKIEDWTVHIK